MLTHRNRGPGRGSVITGKSVHNTRIERFWRDLFQGCTGLYYNLFYAMEDDGLLNASDPTHLYCLHNVFLARVNSSLRIYANAYAEHKLRTEHNQSPIQLWIRGQIQDQSVDVSEPMTPISLVFIYSSSFIPLQLSLKCICVGRTSSLRQDPYGPLPQVLQTSNDVVVPSVDVRLSHELVEDIQQRFNPLRDSDSLGVDIFLEIMNYVQNYMSDSA